MIFISVLDSMGNYSYKPLWSAEIPSETSESSTSGHKTVAKFICVLDLTCKYTHADTHSHIQNTDTGTQGHPVRSRSIPSPVPEPWSHEISCAENLFEYMSQLIWLNWLSNTALKWAWLTHLCDKLCCFIIRASKKMSLAECPVGCFCCIWDAMHFMTK